MSDLILLGYVAKAFGTKGGLHIKLINPEGASLVVESKVTIRLGNSERVMTVSEVVPGNRLYFAEITDRTAAEKLQGAELYLSRADFPELLEDEFYLGDLLGARVILPHGEQAGILIGFSSNNIQVLLEVETPSGHVASVPLVDAIVLDIDCENKIITIDPPLGLLEPMD